MRLIASLLRTRRDDFARILAFSVVLRPPRVGRPRGARSAAAAVIGSGARARRALPGIGVLDALVLSRFLSALLYGIGKRDPLTFAGVAVMLGTVALAASLLPARGGATRPP